MKVAGWAATTAAAVEAADRASADAATGSEAPAASIAADDLASGEVPDWLANMAPPGALEQPAAETMSAGDISSEDMKWLDDLGVTSGGSAEQTPDRFPQENVPGFGAALGIGAAVGATLAARDEEPVEETPALPADETPDWLTQLGGQSTDATAVNLPAVGKQTEQPVTDWLTQLESQAADATAVNLPAVGQPEDDLPDWLVAAAAGAAAAGVINQDQPAQADSDLPDWLKNAGDVMPVS
jgi:hypothetical protein